MSLAQTCSTSSFRISGRLAGLSRPEKADCRVGAGGVYCFTEEVDQEEAEMSPSTCTNSETVSATVSNVCAFGVISTCFTHLQSQKPVSVSLEARLCSR